LRGFLPENGVVFGWFWFCWLGWKFPVWGKNPRFPGVLCARVNGFFFVLLGGGGGNRVWVCVFFFESRKALRCGFGVHFFCSRGTFCLVKGWLFSFDTGCLPFFRLVLFFCGGGGKREGPGGGVGSAGFFRSQPPAFFRGSRGFFFFFSQPWGGAGGPLGSGSGGLLFPLCVCYFGFCGGGGILGGEQGKFFGLVGQKPLPLVTFLAPLWEGGVLFLALGVSPLRKFFFFCLFFLWVGSLLKHHPAQFTTFRQKLSLFGQFGSKCYKKFIFLGVKKNLVGSWKHRRGEGDG